MPTPAQQKRYGHFKKYKKPKVRKEDMEEANILTDDEYRIASELLEWKKKAAAAALVAIPAATWGYAAGMHHGPRRHK